MKVTVLASTSSGNSTLIRYNNSGILIDCGLGIRYFLECCKTLQISMTQIKGVCVTHTHSDHIKEPMVKRLLLERIPIYCHINMKYSLSSLYPSLRDADEKNLIHYFDSQDLVIDQFTIKPIEVPHDSDGGCYGYSVTVTTPNDTKKISIATDLAKPSAQLISHFANSDIIVLESNHDPIMLKNSGRPIWLQQRILKTGHLSNEQSASCMTDILSNSTKLPKAIMLAHISQECNTNNLAIQTMQNVLSTLGTNIPIYETYKDKISETIEL